MWILLFFKPLRARAGGEGGDTTVGLRAEKKFYPNATVGIS